MERCELPFSLSASFEDASRVFAVSICVESSILVLAIDHLLNAGYGRITNDDAWIILLLLLSILNIISRIGCCIRQESFFMNLSSRADMILITSQVHTHFVYPLLKFQFTIHESSRENFEGLVSSTSSSSTEIGRYSLSFGDQRSRVRLTSTSFRSKFVIVRILVACRLHLWCDGERNSSRMSNDLSVQWQTRFPFTLSLKLTTEILAPFPIYQKAIFSLSVNLKWAGSKMSTCLSLWKAQENKW